MGYDEALLMDDNGCVCEGTGENLFLVRDGVLKTPPTSASILPGLTRATTLYLARSAAEELHLSDIREESLTRGELMVADEVFFTGTAAEITPIREVAGRPVGEGKPGPITMALQKRFFDVVHGRATAPRHWRTTFGALVR
jgi:branched-chain amino acid aminotransferase